METTSAAASPDAALTQEHWLERTRTALEFFRVDSVLRELKDGRCSSRLILQYQRRHQELARELGL